MSLFSCVRGNTPGHTTAYASSRVYVKVSSVKELFPNVRDIANTIMSGKPVYIEMNNSYHMMFLDSNQKIDEIPISKSSSGLWAWIKGIFSSSSSQWSQVDELKRKLDNEILIKKLQEDEMLVQQFLDNEQKRINDEKAAQQFLAGKQEFADRRDSQSPQADEYESTDNVVAPRVNLETIKQTKLATARSEQENIGEICRNVLSGKKKALNFDKLSAEGKYKSRLSERLPNLSERILERMGYVKDEKSLDALSAAHSDLLNNLVPSMIALSAKNEFDKALEVLLCFANTQSTALNGMPGMQTILMSLCGRLAQTGANPAVVFASLAGPSALPKSGEGYSWLGEIIKYTHADHKEAAVGALGDGALKKAFIAELNRLLPVDKKLPADGSTSQDIFTAWQSLPAPRAN